MFIRSIIPEPPMTLNSNLYANRIRGLGHSLAPPPLRGNPTSYLLAVQPSSSEKAVRLGSRIMLHGLRFSLICFPSWSFTKSTRIVNGHHPLEKVT
jgi:hypothetical protein